MAEALRLSFASGHATPLRDAATALLQTAELPGSHSLVYAQSGAAPVGEDEYSRVLGDSIFALAPTGNVAETWRLTEALDAGAIPVVTGDSAHFRSAGYPPALVDLFVDVGSLSHRIRRARADAELAGAVRRRRRVRSLRARRRRRHRDAPPAARQRRV